MSGALRIFAWATDELSEDGLPCDGGVVSAEHLADAQELVTARLVDLGLLFTDEEVGPNTLDVRFYEVAMPTTAGCWPQVGAAVVLPLREA